MKKTILGLFVLSALGLAATASVGMRANGVFAAFGSGSGTEEDPYMISTAAELSEILDTVNATSAGTLAYEGVHFKFANDITLTRTASSVYDTRFGGHIDGDNKTLTFDYAATAKFACMFNCNYGTIENLKTAGSISNTHADGYASPLCTYNFGTVRNIENSATVTATGNCVGGILVKNNNNGIVEDCINHGKISTSKMYAGGVICWNGQTTSVVRNCLNDGEVSATTDCAGGVVGLVDAGTVEGCVNKGTVTCAASVGGVVGTAGSNGKSYTFNIKSSVNYGAVKASGKYAGGILGKGYTGTDCVISDCLEAGVVTNNNNGGTGSLIGWAWNSVANSTLSVLRCTTVGSVTCSAGWVGGIFGYQTSNGVGSISFEKCVSAASVTNTSSGTGDTGGFAVGQSGTNKYHTLKDCYSVATVSAANETAMSQGWVLTGSLKVDSEQVNLPEGGLSVTDNARKVIELVKCFECDYGSAEKTALQTALNDCTDIDLDLLDFLPDYRVEEQTGSILDSARYILDYTVDSTANLSFAARNTTVYAIAGVVAFAVVALVSLVFIRRKAR